MTVPSKLYRPPLALVTDFYELTMAAAAWRSGIAGREAIFTLAYRKEPFAGGFTVAAGLADVVDFIEHYRFGEEDLSFLAAQKGADGAPIFDAPFLDFLRKMEMGVDVDAMPEGTVAFPQEPLLRVRGPIVPCMLLETAILTQINFQTLVATKAARVVLAAQGEPVLEFGLRRAQGIDGGLSASRAAYVGGCTATSNTLAGRLYGIPVRGTHAHSWVMLFDEERAAFEAYARALPGNCVFLVDTYDTPAGVQNAIEVGRWLQSQGKELVGIRLDSGDLAWLSIEARRLLDEAGFPKAVIFASNELDESIIQSLKDQGARIGAWGVGTRLVTGADEAALGGVYKLGATRDGPAAPWRHRVKVSEQSSKTSIPGALQVRRYRNAEGFLADAIWDELTGLPGEVVIIDPFDPTRRREIPPDVQGEDLLVPVFRGGRRVYDPPPLEESRARTAEQLDGFHQGVKRFVNPHRFPVGLERGLFDLRTRLVMEARHVK